MNSKPVLPFLETMITQVCNLSCQGCTNYSDLKHSGYVSWAQGQQQLEQWLSRISIPDFGIMGGEPLINPEWRQWIFGVRSLMPQSQIRFTTNGLLLNRAQDLLAICQQVGNIVLKISVHTHSQELQDHIDQIHSAADWTPVVEHGVSRYKTHNNVRFQVNRPANFLKTYQGSYENMRPWHSDPEQAFDLCVQKTCPLLYQGRIYKCSTAGLLQSTLDRFSNPNALEWQPYVHSGIGVNDSDHDIDQFINNFGKHSNICAQCPDSPQSQLDHYSTVIFKSK
jgi:organic radical activating enzyme